MPRLHARSRLYEFGVLMGENSLQSRDNLEKNLINEAFLISRLKFSTGLSLPSESSNIFVWCMTTIVTNLLKLSAIL